MTTMSYCSYYYRPFCKIYAPIHNIFSDPTFSLPFIEGSPFLQRNGTKYTLQACMYKQKMNISDGKVHVTTLILSDEEPCLWGTTSTMCIAYERQLKKAHNP